jgi:AcrR family transcriptional regulator
MVALNVKNRRQTPDDGSAVTAPSAAGKSPGRRGAAKQRRRDQILLAARRILIGAPEMFSMRKLAEEANVSVHTIYNLIGDQSAVVEEIVNGPGRELIANVRLRPNKSPLMELLSELEQFERAWSGDSDPMLAAVRAIPLLHPGALREWVSKAISDEYLSLLTKAVTARELLPEPNPTVLVEQLVTLICQALQIWAQDGQFEALQRRIQVGFVVVMLSATPEAYRFVWEERLRRFSGERGPDGSAAKGRRTGPEPLVKPGIAARKANTPAGLGTRVNSHSYRPDLKSHTRRSPKVPGRSR